MRKQWITPLALSAVLLIAVFISLGPARTTLALWFDELVTEKTTAQTGRYTLDFADVSSNSESSDPTQPPVWNHPGLTVTNDSATLARTMTISRVQLTSRYAYPQNSLNPVHSSRITFALAPAGQTCESGSRNTVWTVKEAGQAPPPDAVYTPAEGAAQFTVPPGETRHLCIDVALDSASSTSEERSSLLRRFAGAGIKAITEITPTQQLSTGGGESGTITSLYRVGFPQPHPSQAITSDTGTPGCLVAQKGWFSGYMQLQWAWPRDSAFRETSTPVVDHWEIWSRPLPSGSWSKITDGSYLRDKGSNQHSGGNIPAEKREAFVERGIIRSASFFSDTVHRQFAVVGVLNNAEKTRFVASQGWDLSWNGIAGSWNSEYRCNGTFPTPQRLTGAPNLPDEQW